MATVAFRRGRWVLDFYDQYGKRKVITTKAKTKKEAQEQLDEIKRSVKNETYIPQNKVPFFIEVATDWLDYKNMTLESSTWNTYEQNLRLHLEPFHYQKISDIKVPFIEKFIGKKMRNGMNVRSLRKALLVLNGNLEVCCQAQLYRVQFLPSCGRSQGAQNFASGGRG